MLHPEKAKKQIKQFEIKKAAERRLAALAKLPKGLAVLGRALVGCDANGKRISNWEKRNKAEQEAYRALEECAAAERQKIFAAFYPKLDALLEAAWQMLKGAPLEIDYDTRAFRAPNHPALTLGQRESWLSAMLNELHDFNPEVVDAKWLATWAAHLGWGGADHVGPVLAAALNQGGAEADEILTILRESASNQHEIGGMGRHVTEAMMMSSRPEAWEFIEKFLLAAQRQEGLRQSILEAIDLAHPQAFRRMLRLILDQNLLRFSSVVRAADVWFGLNWDQTTVGVVRKTLQQVQSYFDDPKSREEALRKGDAESLYLALWTIAFDDALAALKPAAESIKDAKVDRRFATVVFLSYLGIPQSVPLLIQAMDDADLRVALKAHEAVTARGEDDEAKVPEELFPAIERLLPRLSNKVSTLKPLVWPWMEVVHARANVANDLTAALGARPPSDLVRYLPYMDATGRVQVLEKLSEQKTWDDATRQTLFGLVNDPASYIRERALESIKKCKITVAEARQLEAGLSRKNTEFRRGVVSLLLSLPDAEVLASADRLLLAKNANQRRAGLEVLRQLVEKRRALKLCRERAEHFQKSRKSLSEEEKEQVEILLNPDRKVATLEDALGLMNPAARTPVIPPTKKKVTFITPAAVACLESLDELVKKHAETLITIPTEEGPQEQLLGAVGWEFPSTDMKLSAEDDLKRLPLREVWEKWWQERPKKLRDRDGLELERAALWLDIGDWNWDEWTDLAKHSPEMKAAIETISGGFKPLELIHHVIVDRILEWCRDRLQPPQGVAEYALDAFETALALVPARELTRKVKDDEVDWREAEPFEMWRNFADRQARTFTDDQRVRYWRLCHWRNQPVPGVAAMRPPLEVLLPAFRLGVANEHDVYNHLLGGRQVVEGTFPDFDALDSLTQRIEPSLLRENPEVKPLVERCRERILEVELARGEQPTAASPAARALQSVWGTETLFLLLEKLGKNRLKSDYYGVGKASVLTHLIEVAYPRPSDTLDAFKARAKTLLGAGLLTRERLLEIAFFAPQWLKYVEHTLEWEGLSEGVWWFLAHMPYGKDGVVDEDEESEERTMSSWERLISERTALTAEEREEGAVDAAWFQRVYAPLGRKRWEALAEAARVGSSAHAAKKAVLLAQVLLGKANKRQLLAGVKQNLKESVRLLGLLPLASGEKREADLHTRYRALQGYRRYAKQLGPMSREDALRAAAIGFENLARTAGYVDPIRLEWAMEAREIADLAAGPLQHTAEGVTVTLSLDELGQPQMTVQRGEKALKTIPPKVRRERKIAALSERRQDLKRQTSRIRESLETALCRGDAFTGAELKQLCAHPLLRPLLERLVLLGEGIAGYVVEKGQGLCDYTGKVEPIKNDEKLRLAHPYDLYRTGEWDRWQHECFTHERVQPFKQIFRELYVLSEQEKADGAVSRRYAGHQVNPNQARALFTSRRWRADEDGISKIFHEVGLVAEVELRHHGWTAAQVEGWTLDSVRFVKRSESKPLLLTEVPPLLFSEAMRDLDLVVSVAHLGGVDPEASASTVQMRAALLRETCALLKIDNIRFKGDTHVLVDGQLGNYSIHLGSAVVHRLPGGSVCIVPVHAQHRGRLFLPFADDDPRTAEVISKVLLLARDHEIQDPTILAQLRAKA